MVIMGLFPEPGPSAASSPPQRAHSQVSSSLRGAGGGSLHLSASFPWWETSSPAPIFSDSGSGPSPPWDTYSPCALDHQAPRCLHLLQNPELHRLRLRSS